MDDDWPIRQAMDFFRAGYEYQMRGEVGKAISAYRQSIDLFPTAEAHTFLGWAFSFQGRYNDAISECRRAIELDPDFGNPYNDIGAYLIEMEKLDESVHWLEKAKQASRYEPRHFPFYNLGRVYLARGMLKKAESEFQTALRLHPGYHLAHEALAEIQLRLN